MGGVLFFFWGGDSLAPRGTGVYELCMCWISSLTAGKLEREGEGERLGGGCKNVRRWCG